MIRKADLENHNKDGGQWIVIGGQVYDIEDFRSASMADSEDITKLLEATASQGKYNTIDCKLFIILLLNIFQLFAKFIYSEKATQFCKISTVDLSYVVTVKSMVEISQNCVAFSKYMNFTFFPFNF